MAEASENATEPLGRETRSARTRLRLIETAIFMIGDLAYDGANTRALVKAVAYRTETGKADP